MKWISRRNERALKRFLLNENTEILILLCQLFCIAFFIRIEFQSNFVKDLIPSDLDKQANLIKVDRTLY